MMRVFTTGKKNCVPTGAVQVRTTGSSDSDPAEEPLLARHVGHGPPVALVSAAVTADQWAGRRGL
jgi:hypothetical protein